MGDPAVSRSTAAGRSPSTPDDHPHIPPPETGQSPPPPPRTPLRPHHRTPSSPLNHRGPYPRPRPRHPSPPTTKTGSVAPSGQGTRQRREGERTGQYSRGRRGEWGLGASREARRAWGGAWRRAAGDRRPAEAPGPRSRHSVQGQRREATGRHADPQRGAATRQAAQPARRDRRIRTVRSAAGGKAVVAGATGKGNVAGRSGKEGHRRRRHPERGKGGGTPGRGWRGGREGGGEPPLCTPPPTFSRGPSSPTSGKATGPDRPPGARRLPDVFPSLTFPSGAAGVEERLRRRAGRGETTAPLSEPTTLMILPQVQLWKTCQLICL
ncbi:basic salivary proline-rich protein 2-like [Cervus elaphus]|uniref:basic salivary proline-rich protein 2-like n=1 Tax=Cervus elaphus TaxID=9860 RepID=UPI001CC32082|nr:basic salivary proline-rich protein 2-like [Cervus elaphus]